MALYGLILSGGRGNRLGDVSKGALRMSGLSLLDRTARHFRASGAALLVSVGRDGQDVIEDAIVLPDLDLPVGGPVAGLLAAADHLRDASMDDVLVSAAVDSPFLPDDYVERLLAALERGGVAAQAGWRGNFYPTNAAWRLSALAALPQQARDGTLARSPRALLADVSAAEVDWGATHDADPFQNLNTLGDLVALARRARSERQ